MQSAAANKHAPLAGKADEAVIAGTPLRPNQEEVARWLLGAAKSAPGALGKKAKVNDMTTDCEKRVKAYSITL